MATKSSKARKHEDTTKLRASENYREFLKAYLEFRSLSLSDLARASGFGRGFPGDVISGKRRLTAKSAYAFEQALKLPASGRKLFRLLVAREEPDVFPELNPQRVREMIAEIRLKPWASSYRRIHESEKPEFVAAFRDPRAILVYTASGRPERGATLPEILKRTALPLDELKGVLLDLQRSRLLVFDEAEERYVPQDLHMFVQAGETSELFIRLFRQACLAASERVLPALSSESEFFFTSTLTVDQSRLPALKTALRETILKFVDESIDAEGDRISKLTVAFHSPPSV